MGRFCEGGCWREKRQLRCFSNGTPGLLAVGGFWKGFRVGLALDQSVDRLGAAAEKTARGYKIS